MENPNALKEGTCVADFRVADVLGAGGFGITYRAHDLKLDRTIALKEYFPVSLALRVDGETVASRPDGVEGGYTWGLEKFLQEANALAKLSHANIVGVNSFFYANCTAYMVLDFIEGPSLKQWLRALRRKPNSDEIDRLFAPLLDALDAIHRKGLLHRDIAPKNIMLAKPFTPLLIDFGAARELVAHRSQTFAALLTPGYAPFEQYMASTGSQGPWTDLYSLGATFYEAITGAPPPDSPERTLDDRCVPIADIGRGRYRPELLDAIDWMLRPMPKDRPQSIADLRAFLGGLDPSNGSSATANGEFETKPFSWTRMSQWFAKG